MSKLKVISVLVIALIFIVTVYSYPSFANSFIVQTKCVASASLANDQLLGATFVTRPVIGDFVYAVITVQGSTNQVISYTNVTDNTDANGANPQYTHAFRTTDHGNTLIVSFQNYTVDTVNNGINFIVSASYHATTNVNNFVVVCIYELTGLTTHDTIKTSEKSGGVLPQATGTTGIVTLTGADGNSAGGSYAFTGTFDSSGLGNTQGIGNGVGSWSGLTGIAFVIEGDLSISNMTTTTFTVTAWNTIGVATPSNWIVLALMLLFFPSLTWGLLKGFDAPPSTTIFGTLVALFFGAVIGVIGDYEAGSSAVFPFGIVVADAIFLAVYLFRSRSRSGIS